MDYLAVGHVTKDLTPNGARLGGTVTFASLTAQALGLRVGALTSAPDDVVARKLLAPLGSLTPLAIIPSDTFTTFENVYHSGHRTQIILGRATPLTVAHVSGSFRRAGIVHLAPLADEVDPALVAAFPGALVGVTPQGWMRTWDDRGRVSFRRWQGAEKVLSQVRAVVMSIEDVVGDEGYVDELAGLMRMLVVTRGGDGCTLFEQGERIDIPALCVEAVDPTGAGDVFAAAFFSRLYVTGEPLDSVRFAMRLASASVTRAGVASIPTQKEVATALGVQ